MLFQQLYFFETVHKILNPNKMRFCAREASTKPHFDGKEFLCTVSKKNSKKLNNFSLSSNKRLADFETLHKYANPNGFKIYVGFQIAD